MIDYKYVNVNPKGRKTGDCSTRALVGVLGITYEYVKMKQPRKEDGKKYTVGELDEILTKRQIEEGVLVTIARHHTCIKNGSVQDIWDCRYKTVGNYYVKG